jgi:hypothetical protein
MWRHTRRPVIAVVALVVSALAVVPAAEAAFGDYHVIRGKVTVWPPGSPTSGVVVVRGTDGKRYFVRFDSDTARSPGLGQGDPVTIVGSEGDRANRIDAKTVERSPGSNGGQP